MTMVDIARINAKLRNKNIPALLNKLQFHVGDRVRYLISESDLAHMGQRFKKGGERYSDTVWIVTDIDKNNIRIERNNRRGETEGMWQKYWQLKKV